jgi:hypothetical protein
MQLANDWMDDPDQRLIDATLDDRIAQIEQTQRDLAWSFNSITNRHDANRAWQHLNHDIAVLQPQSSIPF